MSPDFKYPKEIRLKSRKQIEALFQTKSSIFRHPLLFKYRLITDSTTTESEFPICFAISVPKKNFPKAVDRNLLKRRIREAIRLNWRKIIGANLSQCYNGLIIYVGKEMLDFHKIEQVIQKLLEEFVQNNQA